MICYILIEKRGDCIKKLINWQLLSNNNEVVNNQKVECEFNNNILKYVEDNNTVNIIDIDNKTYLRENDEFTFNIDFKNRCFNYILKKDNLSIENAKLEAFLEQDENIISLKYNLGEEEKKIVIQLL